MFRQLSIDQRLTIENLQRKGCKQSEIARQLGVHRSTVKRELERNSINGVYKAAEAQANTQERKQKAGIGSQQGKTKKPAGFKWKLRVAFWMKKEEEAKETKKVLSKGPYKPRKNQLRGRRYQANRKRQDKRNYKLHANKKRPFGYRRWKSRYESHFRFRDNAKAEQNRLWRTGPVFQRYYRSKYPSGLRYKLSLHRRWRKFKRERYEQRMREFQRKTDQLNQELMEIRLKWEEVEKQQQERLMEPEETAVITIEKEEVQGPFFFFVFSGDQGNVVRQVLFRNDRMIE
jgi:hypothetical protein